IWQATYSWLGGQRLAPLSPLRHAPKPMQRIAARRQLWSPYLAILDGTRHAGAFRRMVLNPTRAPALDPARTPLLPLRNIGTRAPIGLRERTGGQLVANGPPAPAVSQPITTCARPGYRMAVCCEGMRVDRAGVTYVRLIAQSASA